MANVDLPPRGTGVDLFGRHREFDVIRAFLARACAHGEALLLVGEPGVGKTALLEAAADTAVAAGARVLLAAGVEFEADIGFSGLNQALLPLLGGLGHLDAVHRDALTVALGLGEGPPPDRLLVCTATLALLRWAATNRPLVLIVDDVPWLDRLTAGVLGFVARRVAGSRVGFLAAARSGAESFFERAGLPEHEVQPLDDEAAADLMSARFPALAPRVRQRLLAEAQGNPLALLELPAALSVRQRAALRTLPAVLPLSGRLQALFASRIGTLPPRTRQLLLLTALDGTGDPRVLRAITTRPQALEDLADAERARLVRVDEATHRLAFHHPLIRSAVADLSTADEHRRAHAALAELLAEHPDRRAWHLAQSTVEPDERVAALLEETGHRALRRGDAVGAVAALMRASELSPDGADRSRRLAHAAYIGADVTGDLRAVAHLLADARRAGAQPGGSLQAAVAASFLLLMGEGDVDTAHRLLVGAIEGRVGSADDTIVEALWTLCMVCFFGGRAELWEPLHAAISRLTDVPAFLSLCGQTFADPARTSAATLDELAGAIAGLHAEADPTRILRIGIAAVYVDRVEGCREALWRVVRDGREGGAIASAINALILMGVVDTQTGRWDEADRLLDEGLALCQAHGYELLAWPGRWGQALLAALGGDQDRVDALCDQMMRWASPRRVASVQLYARHAWELAALGRGDFEEAYRQASAISPPGMLPSHVPHALWVAMDLVEAAVHTDRHAEATAHVSAMREAGFAAISPRLALVTGGSAAIATPDPGTAGVLFAEALTIPGIDEWPLERARVQLAYGERLRRGRATIESRVHLIAALETFEGLGARPWAARAANELRAAGQTRPRPGMTESDPLTAQELEIASLAAAGLTNKQIGQRLFLSHRTVGAHLYRVFPKLGITARAALRDALASRRPE